MAMLGASTLLGQTGHPRIISGAKSSRWRRCEKSTGRDARTSTGGNCRGSKAQRLHDSVMKSRPDLRDFLIFARRIYPVGQQHHEYLAVRIDPYGSAGESGVSEAVRGEIVAAGGALG